MFMVAKSLRGMNDGRGTCEAPLGLKLSPKLHEGKAAKHRGLALTGVLVGAILACAAPPALPMAPLMPASLLDLEWVRAFPRIREHRQKHSMPRRMCVAGSGTMGASLPGT